MKKTVLSTFILCLATLGVMAQNPYLPLWEHLPDGEPRVFEDPDKKILGEVDSILEDTIKKEISPKIGEICFVFITF